MTGYARGEADFPGMPADRYRQEAARPASLTPKDYSVPLHVDCSIEYELPDCAKPPQGVKIEPLLMIHPSHFRRLESLRRVPFVNNLPKTAAAPAPALPAPAAPLPAAEYRFLLDDLLDSRPAAAKPDEYAATAAYRFDNYPDGCCNDYRLANGVFYDSSDYALCNVNGLKASLGKYQHRQRSLKTHPYLATGACAAPDLPTGPDCDISHSSSIQGNYTSTSFDHLTKRKTLQQLPIYM